MLRLGWRCYGDLRQRRYRVAALPTRLVGGGGFHAFACGDEGAHSAHLTSEEKPFLTGAKLFCEMFETGVEPVPPQRYLTSVAVLAAMRDSFAAGVPVTVQRVPEF